MYKDKYITLEKLEGTFRQDLPIGNTEIQGWNKLGIELNEHLYLYNHLENALPISWTSKVLEIDGDIIKTENSIYKITIKEK
jgi:hypothetical protein